MTVRPGDLLRFVHDQKLYEGTVSWMGSRFGKYDVTIFDIYDRIFTVVSVCRFLDSYHLNVMYMGLFTPGISELVYIAVDAAFNVDPKMIVV